LYSGICGGPAAGFISSKPQAYPADPNSVIRVDTNVVLVDAVVTDKKGNYVRI